MKEFKAPNKIWLINCGDDVTWCDSPKPSDGLQKEDVTPYIKVDSGMSFEPLMFCKECRSSGLSWNSFPRVTRGVADGRLSANEVETEFVLGCDDCSETLQVMTASQVVELLNIRQSEALKAKLLGESRATQVLQKESAL